HARLERTAGWLDADWRIDAAWQRVDDDRRTRDFESDERRHEQNASQLFGLSVVADGNVERIDWVAGIDFYDDRVSSARQSESLSTGIVAPIASRFPDGSTVRQASVFANADYAMNDRWHAGAGIRFSSSRAMLAATDTTDAADVRVNDVGLDVSVRYEINDSLTWVSNAGAGFRAPNIFDLGTLGARPGNRFNIPNADLESERVQQIDTGLRFQNDRLRWEAVAFALHYDDRITSVLTGEQTSEGRDIVQTDNASTSDIVGLEFGMGLSFGTRWQIDAVVNATRGEQRELGSDDEPGDRIPPLNGYVSLGYEAPKYRAELRLRGADRQHRLSARDVRDVRIDPNGTSGWAVMDVSFRWPDFSGWVVAAGVENVTDKRYRNHGSGIDAVGRNAFLSLRKTFD
ncbi:MAG: TonB-dependent receptor, partial [Pseudomonadota bacterium]